VSRVRLAGPDDAAEVVRLLLEFRAWYGKPADDAARDQFQRVVEALIVRDDAEYLLGGDGPDAVAQVRYRLSIWTGSEDCWLEDLYVADSARGTGLGRELVAAVLDRARARGCGRAELDVDVENAPARALYAAMGFADKNPGGSLLLQRWL
jgi:GNAT superfamily N-acetyltransferase